VLARIECYEAGAVLMAYDIFAATLHPIGATIRVLLDGGCARVNMHPITFIQRFAARLYLPVDLDSCPPH